MKARWTPRNKYGARKVTIEGIVFDSAKEAKRWQQLRLMERAGEIRSLQRQVSYTLVPMQPGGIRTERSVRYVADFVYERKDGTPVIEDVKSPATRTAEYIVKRKLMKQLGWEITEV